MSKRVKMDDVLAGIPEKFGKIAPAVYHGVYEIMTRLEVELEPETTLRALDYLRQSGKEVDVEIVRKLIPCSQITKDNAHEFVRYKRKGWLRLNAYGTVDEAYFIQKATASIRKALALPREQWLKECSDENAEHYAKVNPPYFGLNTGASFEFHRLLRDFYLLVEFYKEFGTYGSTKKERESFSINFIGRHSQKAPSVDVIRKRVIDRMRVSPVVRALLAEKFGTEDAMKAKKKKTLVEFFTDLLDEWVHQ